MLPTIKRQNNWLPTIFNDFFNDEWFPLRTVATTAPAINVKENDKAFVVEIARSEEHTLNSSHVT